MALHGSGYDYMDTIIIYIDSIDKIMNNMDQTMFYGQNHDFCYEPYFGPSLEMLRGKDVSHATFSRRDPMAQTMMLMDCMDHVMISIDHIMIP